VVGVSFDGSMSTEPQAQLPNKKKLIGWGLVLSFFLDGLILYN
jgi:hypothetical protein